MWNTTVDRRNGDVKKKKKKTAKVRITTQGLKPPSCITSATKYKNRCVYKSRGSGRGPPPAGLAPSFDYHFGIAEGRRAPRQSGEEFLRSITDQLRRTDKFVTQREKGKKCIKR